MMFAKRGCELQVAVGVRRRQLTRAFLRCLTFELSGPLRWTAGPAWCSITERTMQALTAAVAGPLERGVRPERDWVNSER